MNTTSFEDCIEGPRLRGGCPCSHSDATADLQPPITLKRNYDLTPILEFTNSYKEANRSLIL